MSSDLQQYLLENNSNYTSFSLETFSLHVIDLLNVPPYILADKYQYFRYTCTFYPKR